jgi:hypothetical protein
VAAMLTRGILLFLLAVSTPSVAGDVWAPALAQANPTFAQSAQQAPARPPTGPKNFLGRNHPGKITKLSDDGIVVNLKDGGTQVVQFREIWRIRKAFASDEPSGTTVIDYANNRLFVATPLDGLIGDLGKKVPMTKLTAPNGEMIYMVASKVTDISNALPGLHNPASKAVVGTRDGTQQVLEAVDEAKRIISSAHVIQ